MALICSPAMCKATDSEWLQQCFQLKKPHPYACQTHKLKLFQYDGQLHATANGDYPFCQHSSTFHLALIPVPQPLQAIKPNKCQPQLALDSSALMPLNSLVGLCSFFYSRITVLGLTCKPALYLALHCH